MFLAIDCGNSNLVFALYKEVYESDPIIWRCQTNGKKTADEYASWLYPLLQNENVCFSDIKDILIASVVPDVNFNLNRLCEKYIKVNPNFIESDGSNLDLKIDLPNPIRVGSDQLVNAYAAIKKYGTAVVVIDFGTATTFDVVDEKGAFIGGIIAPGVNLSTEALYKAAALLPKIKIEKPSTIIGKNTTEAMQTGLYWGYVSMIEGLAQRVAKEFKVKPIFVATGGLSVLFTDALEIINYADPNLTLEGLRLIRTMNENKTDVRSIA